MNDLTVEQMQDRIKNVKEYAEHYFTGAEHKSHLVIIGYGGFNLGITERLLAAAEILSTPLMIVTPEKIESCSKNTATPLEDILMLIEGLPNEVHSSYLEDKLVITGGIPERIDNIKSFIDQDDRPFYQKMKDKGGKKRKQRW